ncbi:MAG: rhodanese [Clostridia bacterium]|nr:rhodanese [Clostridia bacterium]
MKLKKYISIIFCVICVIILSSCSQKAKNSKEENKNDNIDIINEENKVEYKKITPEEAKDIIDGEEDFIILDVRTESEYNEEHIPNALLIPNEEIGTEPPAELPDKNAVILIYCRSGNRSKTASEKLIKMGYTNIYDFGGIIDWSYETETGN